MAVKLTEKQALFVKEYMIDLNATQAAIRSGYSEKTAHVIGHENLSKPNIADAIANELQERSERTEITADRVLQEYAKIGFADIRKAVKWGDVPVADEDGGLSYPVELISSSEIDGDTASAISEVSLTQQGIKIKLVDKKGALDSMARHLGMFIDKVDSISSDGSMSPKPVDGAIVRALVDKLID